MFSVAQEITLANALNEACDRVGQTLLNLRIAEEVLRLNTQGLAELTDPYIPDTVDPTREELGILGENYLSKVRRQESRDQAAEMQRKASFDLLQLIVDNKGERVGAIAVGEQAHATPIEVLGYVASMGTLATIGRQSQVEGRLDMLRDKSDVVLDRKGKITFRTTSFIVHTLDPYTHKRAVRFTDV